MGLHGPKAVGETRTRSVGAIILRSLAQSCSFHQPATINGNAANNLCIVTISPIECQRIDSKIFYSFVSHVVKYSMLRYLPSKVKPLAGCSIEPMVFCVVICIVYFSSSKHCSQILQCVRNRRLYNQKSTIRPFANGRINETQRTPIRTSVHHLRC